MRKFFNVTGHDSMDAHDSVIFPTFDPPLIPPHMGGVGHWVAIFLDLKSERFQLLDSYNGPTDEDDVRLFRRMTDNIKRLWSDASNDRETPFSPISIDHFPLDWIDVPQQDNNIDCGFYMLTNVNSFHERVLMNYSHENILDIRKTLYSIAFSDLFETDFMDLFGYLTLDKLDLNDYNYTFFGKQVFQSREEMISLSQDESTPMQVPCKVGKQHVGIDGAIASKGCCSKNPLHWEVRCIPS